MHDHATAEAERLADVAARNGISLALLLDCGITDDPDA